MPLPLCVMTRAARLPQPTSRRRPLPRAPLPKSSLPNDGRYPALELTPQQRRQKTLDALHAQAETFARKNPVLMIFEDVHWADPTSLELFGRAVDRIAMLLITYRPEFDPPWIGQPHVTTLTLNRLTRREIEAMIDR